MYWGANVQVCGAGTQDARASRLARMSTLQLGKFGALVGPMVLQASNFIDETDGSEALGRQRCVC